MKAPSLLIFFCLLSSWSALAQDLIVLPTYVRRSQLFVEAGYARPLSGSWINKTDHFVFHGEKTGYFQLAYDRTFIHRPWHLRASIYRANMEIYWTLVNLYGSPGIGPEPEPKEVGLRVQQGVTETAIGFGYTLDLFSGMFLKSTLSLGMANKGTSSFVPEYRYKGTSGDTIEVKIITTRPDKTEDMALMTKLDLELGYNINDVHAIGLCAALAQYGFSGKNPASRMMESTTVFQVESREYTLLTAMRTRTFSFGLRYSYRFNLR